MPETKVFTVKDVITVILHICHGHLEKILGNAIRVHKETKGKQREVVRNDI